MSIQEMNYKMDMSYPNTLCTWEEFEAMRIITENDVLTGIPNLYKFTRDTEKLIKSNTDKTYAFIVFDINRFSLINDIYGSEEGDRLLKFIGSTLKSNLSESTLYCHMYADHFAILLENNHDIDYALLAITLSEETAKYSSELEVILSFGVCKVNNYESTVSALCNKANLAKKTVKGSVLHLLAFYDEALKKLG